MSHGCWHGGASTFPETIQKIADFKPEVLLLDLHLPEKREFTPELVKAQLQSVCMLAVSLSNDEQAKHWLKVTERCRC